MSTINIVMLSHQSALSGAPKILFEIATQLDIEEFSRTVICPEDGPIVQMLKDKSIPVLVINRHFRYQFPHSLQELIASFSGFVSLIKYISQTSRFIKKENPSFVHVNTSVEIPGSIASLIARKPILWHIHEIHPSKLKRWFATHWAILVSSQIIAVSQAVSESLGNHPKVKVVHNCIDLLEFDNQVNRHPLQPPRNFAKFLNKWDYRVLFVGRLTEDKGIHLFLEMALQVLKERGNIGFIVVGEAMSETEKLSLESFCINKQIQDQVYFAGLQTDIPWLMSQSDCVVIPSTVQEGFSLVALEAMSARKPVIAMDVGGISEIVLSRVTGLLISPGNVSELSSAVISLAENPVEGATMGLAGRHRVEEKFTIERYINNMQSIYSSMCNT